MRMLGFEVKRIEKVVEVPKECTHENSVAGDLDEGIYHCKNCGLACIYINQKLIPLTIGNRNLNDKGSTINGIYQF